MIIHGILQREDDITCETKLIRKGYMDRYDGGPPWRGNEAYMANICYLEGELSRVRLILRLVEKESCIVGYESGNVLVESLANEGLRIPLNA